MPFTATSASFGCPPRDPLDLDARYIAQVASITERKMAAYGAVPLPDGSYADGDMEDKMIWALAIHRLDGTPVVNAENGIYSIDAITKVNVSPSRPGKPTSKARIYAEAFLGRDPKVAVDAGEDVLKLLVGRFAYVLLEQKDRLDGGKSVVILRLTPIQDQAAAAGAVAAGVAAASLAAPAAAAAPAALPF